MVERYCAKPVEAEAIQVDIAATEEIVAWGQGSIYRLDSSRFAIVTDSDAGTLIAKIGDWIVKDPTTTESFTLYDANLFEARYKTI